MELTPIEEIDGILFKREDKFILNNVNGGKLRQAICLIEKNLEEIKTKYNSCVVCPCSNPSPQSAIISEVCKLFNLKCKIVTFKTLKPNRNLSIAQSNGAEMYGTKSGWNSVVESKSKLLKGFNIKMGFADEDIIESNIPQVQNIPDYLDYLIIPCGSGFNAISILRGLKKYNKKVDRVFIIFVGKNPTATLETNLKGVQDYTLIRYNSNYSQPVKKFPLLDEIYEAKAFDWIKKNLDMKNKKVLFWVVGKRNETFPFQKIIWKEI